MNTSTRILIGTVITFLIICAGLGVGFYLNAKKLEKASAPSQSAAIGTSPPSVKDALRAKRNTATPDSGEAIGTTDVSADGYDVSIPSRGETLDTVDIEIKPFGNSAFVLLPKKQAEGIEKDQRILLYDADGFLLETLGQVTSADQGTGQLADFVTVRMILNGDEHVSPAKVAKGKIIIKHRGDSPRLPLSALIRNDKNEPFVWRAVPNKDGTYTVSFKPANVLETTYAYFVIDTANGGENLYVLNPDGNLKDGARISAHKIMFQGPDQTDETKIAEMVESRNRLKIDMKAREEAAKDPGEAAPSVAPTNGCPANPAITKNFIDKVKKMASPEELTPVAR